MFTINQGQGKIVTVAGVDSGGNPAPLSTGQLSVSDPSFASIVAQNNIPDGTFKFNLTAANKAGSFTLIAGGSDVNAAPLPAKSEVGTIPAGPAVALTITVS